MNALEDGFLASLRENGIPPRPAALEAIAAEMRSETPDFAAIERQIGRDVAIAGGLLKTVNSPYFGLRRRARSVMEALQILGLDATAKAVACVALRAAFAGLRQMERFWDASARIAELSGWLAVTGLQTRVRGDDAFTFALFRDCGIGVLLMRMPAYADVLRQANAEALRPFTEVETTVLPTHHAAVGAMLTQSWWLPRPVTEAVRCHHALALPAAGAEPSAADELAAIAQLAEYLFQRATGLSPTREWQKLGEACQRHLNLSKPEVAALEAPARKFLG